MKLRKLIAIVGILFTCASFSPYVHADPCGAELCLGGAVDGKSGGPGCYARVADYFSIVIFDPFGDIDWPATSAARLLLLRSCPDPANAELPPRINGRFGDQLTPPPFP